MYQLYAYGKRYGCRAVALVYPQTGDFATELTYRYFDGLPLVCLPFDVTRPEESVRRSIQTLEGLPAARMNRSGDAFHPPGADGGSSGPR